MTKNVMPRLKFCNGYQLVVMGVSLPISLAQARQVFVQLQQLQEAGYAS
ncbi:hypothetical protein G4923_10615 [Aeromonas rivipollensis]|uniref:Uncharacterized protein n=1 Tax=Aeromonas rivipollensis TaxID=948519 RepID=A0ABX0D2G2_9GAMM|nr:hypothetical protein [Aeromonas rivipollensis]NEX89156.1 hypothetical protein [Aeromonas rivipollensis]NEY05022.1 hypothetical protein [Aeromonas rivipollensis]